jgi:hypothetical protein
MKLLELYLTHHSYSVTLGFSMERWDVHLLKTSMLYRVSDLLSYDLCSCTFSHDLALPQFPQVHSGCNRASLTEYVICAFAVKF